MRVGDIPLNPSLLFFVGRVNNRAPSPGALTSKASIASVNPQNILKGSQFREEPGENESPYCVPARLNVME